MRHSAMAINWSDTVLDLVGPNTITGDFVQGISQYRRRASRIEIKITDLE
jgi:hypothetical protein